MEPNINNIILFGSSSLILGFAVGYAIKKLLRLVLFIIGLFIIILSYLAYLNVITVNFDVLYTLISDSIVNTVQGIMEFKDWALTNLTLTSGFTLGFIFGIKKG